MNDVSGRVLDEEPDGLALINGAAEDGLTGRTVERLSGQAKGTEVVLGEHVGTGPNGSFEGRPEKSLEQCAHWRGLVERGEKPNEY